MKALEMNDFEARLVHAGCPRVGVRRDQRARL